MLNMRWMIFDCFGLLFPSSFLVPHHSLVLILPPVRRHQVVIPQEISALVHQCRVTIAKKLKFIALSIVPVSYLKRNSMICSLNKKNSPNSCVELTHSTRRLLFYNVYSESIHYSMCLFPESIQQSFVWVSLGETISFWFAMVSKCI